jgi:hypothetical protein
LEKSESLDGERIFGRGCNPFRIGGRDRHVLGSVGFTGELGPVALWFLFSTDARE